MADRADVSAAHLRRNGKKSSCEPCRKSKLSCDHIRPICGRCRRRRVPESCVYHPAPMTSGQRPSPSSTIASQSLQDEQNLHRLSTASASSHDFYTSASLLEDKVPDSSPPVPGFLGPTSYSAVFTEGQSHLSKEDGKLSSQINVRGWKSPVLPSWDSGKIKEGAEVLSLLAHVSKYKSILNRRDAMCLSDYTHYISDCIALIPSTLKDSHGQPWCLNTLSHNVFTRTSTPCLLDANMSLREYPSFLMGENLCWETVGLMLSALGLSAVLMDEVNTYEESHPEPNWKDLAQRLLRAADQCITFCEQYGHLKDTGVTLIMANFILHTQVYGDADFHCWRKLGDLTTALFALGLHQEPKPDLPFFLAELHRKLFWSAYTNDKTFATFFGRPPMMNGKFCSCRLPLDLEHFQLGLQGEALTSVLNDLDHEGWNSNTAMGAAAWLRVSIVSAKFREEVLELSLGACTDNLDERARKTKKRLRESEESLPFKLRDRSDRWVLERKAAENYAQLSKHLDFVYNEFLIERTLVKRCRVPPAELVAVSKSLLSSLLTLTGNRHHLGSYTNDLPWLIALYGLPPAGVLALELLHHSRNKQQMTHDFPRSDIIQSLSNLISTIEFVVRPTNGNFVICGQAKKMLQAILDTVLSPEHNQSEYEHAEPAAAADTAMEVEFDEQIWLNNNLNMEFWTNLEDHPLLAWPEVTENS